MAQTLRERSQMDPAYTWQITDLYPTDDAWRADCERLRGLLAQMAGYKGHLNDSAATLLAFLQLQDQVLADGDQLLSYAYRKTDEDTRQPVYQEMSAQADNFEVEWEQARAFQTPELLAIDEARLASFYKEEPQLEHYRLMLDRIRSKKDHTLSAEGEALLADVKIPNPERVAKQYPFQLSGGMRQRVMIAMALACKPKLLIADEPTTALDVTIQAQVLELMNELKEKLRTSLLLITHDLGVVAQVCDRVAIMYAGEIVESGTIAEVFDHPHHPYTIGLFGSIPSLDETAEKLKPIQGQMPDPTELPEGCAFAPRCPYATGACRTRKPEMTGVGGTQMVRCLAHQGVFESPKLMEEVRHGR